MKNLAILIQYYITWYKSQNKAYMYITNLKSANAFWRSTYSWNGLHLFTHDLFWIHIMHCVGLDGM